MDFYGNEFDLATSSMKDMAECYANGMIKGFAKRSPDNFTEEQMEIVKQFLLRAFMAGAATANRLLVWHGNVPPSDEFMRRATEITEEIEEFVEDVIRAGMRRQAEREGPPLSFG